jgi:hypothetical protein
LFLVYGLCKEAKAGFAHRTQLANPRVYLCYTVFGCMIYFSIHKNSNKKKKINRKFPEKIHLFFLTQIRSSSIRSPHFCQPLCITSNLKKKLHFLFPKEKNVMKESKSLL